jgi:CheY-specific phosphatase CheX
MSKMHNPAKRLALAQQLFGRGARTLLPLLLKGRQGLQDQLNVVKKYGAQLGVHTVKELQEMISHQREMKIASEGMKVQLTTALLPVMMQLEGAFVAIVRADAAVHSAGLGRQGSARR